jgi:hypothetical protein
MRPKASRSKRRRFETKLEYATDPPTEPIKPHPVVTTSNSSLSRQWRHQRIGVTDEAVNFQHQRRTANGGDCNE